MALQIIHNFRRPHKGILQEPDKRLRFVSEEVGIIDKSSKEIVNSLIQILKEVDKPYKPWLGMAAPQLGYNKRIIVIKRSFNKYLIMINPEIINQKLVFPTISGCYSLKGLYLITSPHWMKIKFMDLYGRTHTEVFKGGEAVLLKQEVDHLNGKLICD